MFPDAADGFVLEVEAVGVGEPYLDLAEMGSSGTSLRLPRPGRGESMDGEIGMDVVLRVCVFVLVRYCDPSLQVF